MSSDRFEYTLRYGNHPIDSDVAEAMFKATDALPGSEEKKQIMARRVALGQSPFHENDRTDFAGIGLVQTIQTLRGNDE
jgi:hypothetical protein